MANEQDWEEDIPTTQNDKKESRVLFSFKEFFGIFTDFVRLCKETGPLRIAGYVVFFIFTAYAVHIGTHPDIIFEKYEEYAEQRHAESFYYRMKTSPQVQSYMDQMRLESNGMRTFIIEMHNGKYNAAGLSFNYGALHTKVSAKDIIQSSMTILISPWKDIRHSAIFMKTDIG